MTSTKIAVDINQLISTVFSICTCFPYNFLHHQFTIHATQALKAENILYLLKKNNSTKSC